MIEQKERFVFQPGVLDFHQSPNFVRRDFERLQTDDILLARLRNESVVLGTVLDKPNSDEVRLLYSLLKVAPVEVQKFTTMQLDKRFISMITVISKNGEYERMVSNGKLYEVELKVEKISALEVVKGNSSVVFYDVLFPFTTSPILIGKK